MEIKTIKRWEIWGAAFSIFAGSALHFVFNWSGQNHFVALFGAVNESTWEHLKIAFWPTFIFAVIEWFFFGKVLKNFCFATFLKLFTIPVAIIGLFYGWLLFFEDNFIYDISIFALAIIFGYWLSYKIIKSQKIFGPQFVWAILILVLLVKFSLFAFYPPKNFLFYDPVNRDYGIGK